LTETIKAIKLNFRHCLSKYTL